jgi:hypothetical protein
MRLISPLFTLLLAILSAPLVSAVQLIESNALNLCQDSANFTATLFKVTFTPNNRSLVFSFDGVAAISGKVKAEITLDAYGYQALKEELDPCKLNIGGLCPMTAGPIDVPKAQIDVPQSVVNKIPGGLKIRHGFSMVNVANETL